MAVPYEIIEILESGSYGTVCLALDPRMPVGKQVVALKILKEELLGDERFIKRLRDEGRMLEMLDHPSIVRLFEISEIDGRPVLVMEYVAGVPVVDLLDPSPTGVYGPAALEIVRRVADALDAAWSTRAPGGGEMHIVHRDIKPSNILLSADGDVKLLDFGLAKAEFRGREARTRSRILGTLGFIAPERLAGFQIGPRATCSPSAWCWWSCSRDGCSTSTRTKQPSRRRGRCSSRR